MTESVLQPLTGTYQRSGRLVWQACCLGYEPAESLHWIDREHLVLSLLGQGLSLRAIAGRTRQSLYTTARIVGQFDARQRQLRLDAAERAA